MLRAKAMEDEILKHTDEAGAIDNLSIDFAGQYVPIVDQAEARIVARLLAAFGATEDVDDTHEDSKFLASALEVSVREVSISVVIKWSLSANHIRSRVTMHAKLKAEVRKRCRGRGK